MIRYTATSLKTDNEDTEVIDTFSFSTINSEGTGNPEVNLRLVLGKIALEKIIRCHNMSISTKIKIHEDSGFICDIIWVRKLDFVETP